METVLVAGVIIIAICVLTATYKPYKCPLCGAAMKMYSSTRQGYFAFYCPQCKKDFILKGWR